jgi:hypothetical protein
MKRHHCFTDCKETRERKEKNVAQERKEKMQDSREEDRLCTYDITLTRVPATIVVVEKQ